MGQEPLSRTPPSVSQTVSDSQIGREGARRPADRLQVPSKYQRLRILGSGGMGTVVLARDRALGRLVALKFLHESCQTFQARFRREARTMARLAHPSIVKVHELGFHEERLYLAMEYIDGGSLMLARLGPRELVQALRGVVDALGFAHEHGIVHRDVKPENVLLDRNGHAFLSDFGIALDPDEGSERDVGRPVVGTPLTMSPEQARAERVTPSSDMFSLGVTLYHALTGQWPFRGRAVADVLYAINHEEPTPPRQVNPAVPRKLEELVLRCLRKRPEERFASMAEVGAALDRVNRPSLFGRASSLLRGSGGVNGEKRPTGPRIHPEESL